MKRILWPIVLSVLSACAHPAKKVDCDQHLTAINPPTPVVKTDAPKNPPP